MGEYYGNSMQQNEYPSSYKSPKMQGPIPNTPTADYWPSLSEKDPNYGYQKQSAESNDFWQNFQGMDHSNKNKVL